MMEAYTAPIAQGDDIPAFFFVSTHGGAGASTLAACIAPGFDAGQGWPVADVNPYVFLVAGDSLESLDQAHQALVQAPEGIKVLGLIVNAHTPGKPSRALVGKLRVLRQLTDVYEFPFVKQFRDSALSDLPSWTPGAEQPGRLRRTKNSIPEPVARLGHKLSKKFLQEYTNC